MYNIGLLKIDHLLPAGLSHRPLSALLMQFPQMIFKASRILLQSKQPVCLWYPPNKWRNIFTTVELYSIIKSILSGLVCKSRIYWIHCTSTVGIVRVREIEVEIERENREKGKREREGEREVREREREKGDGTWHLFSSSLSMFPSFLLQAPW